MISGTKNKKKTLPNHPKIFQVATFSKDRSVVGKKQIFYFGLIKLQYSNNKNV
jgi:hypothetical protein